MIFESDGVTVIQFGFGDVKISTGKISGQGEIFSTISFSPIESGDIGRYFPDDCGKKDTDIGAHTRLVFLTPDSIDVLIERLEEARRTISPNPPSPKER